MATWVDDDYEVGENESCTILEFDKDDGIYTVYEEGKIVKRYRLTNLRLMNVSEVDNEDTVTFTTKFEYDDRVECDIKFKATNNYKQDTVDVDIFKVNMEKQLAWLNK